ncbi:formyltransferase family protein [Pseudomonas sp. CAU 1711]|uniref:formyltransferase family protein n=1 Tax=Pseudomonas sp. CAU 1711 TaxID=3140356 RepID=UPI003260A21E
MHPVNGMLQRWMEKNKTLHQVALARSKRELASGDILFLISCGEIITEHERRRFKKTLVIHASDLPRGRGWSPHIWELTQGAAGLTVSLLEAQDKVDSGDIWKKVHIDIPPHALYQEINELLFRAESELMDFAVEHFDSVVPMAQDCSIEPTYYPRRGPADSELDPQLTIASQFNLLRVCDPERFPAFFKLHGHRYKLTIERLDDE